MAKIVLTTHAVERMWQRRISQNMIEQTVQKADGKKYESDGDTQFHRTLKSREIHVVAKPLERDDWLIKTVWVDGEKDPHPLWKLLVKIAIRVLRR
ncbi:MAG: DUF4258 domain-containing protein [Anaerolineae bacterium]|nr:DUF4258 domain-containing protein [Anaerolineae bacterium]MDQ7034602.1 DUF4258 domain-containing protein [Anaerolineae bacterium]